MSRLIILDTETTGFEPRDGHKLVEIGALEMINMIPTGRQFHYYINPERDVPIGAYKVHGLSQEFLRDKPLFSAVADEFLEFIEGAQLVIHNAKFDMKFLNHELKLLNKQTLDMSIAIDTLLIARKRFPGSKASLDALCKRFKIDLSKRGYHGALLDSQLLMEVYIALMGGADSRQSKMEFTKEDIEKKKEISSIESHIYQANKIVTPTESEMKNHKEMISKIKNPIWDDA